ncbi:hypothetical protein WNZ14_21910 [Hoeflea sp. AS60]|uniref:hypothetical protein n=1 Tax=Hoeflea sp. AS60 TaxID=3135780 RepID=UPI00317C556D
MTRRVILIITAFLLIFTSPAYSKIVKIKEQSKATFGTIELAEDILKSFQGLTLDGDPYPPHEPKGTKIHCHMRVVEQRCFDDQGIIQVESLIPVLPENLLMEIGGFKLPFGEAKFREKKFWRNIDQFESHLDDYSPIDSRWASPYYYKWLSSDRNKKSAEVLKLIQSIYRYHSAQSKVDEFGFFIADVTHPQSKRVNKSLQFCWLSFKPTDPFASRCTAIFAVIDDMPFVRFIYGYYNGGYMFEEAVRLSCISNSENSTKDTIEAVFGNLESALEKSNSGFVRNSDNTFVVEEEWGGRGILTLDKKFKPSAWFPSKREATQITLKATFGASENDIDIVLNYSFLLSAQNVGNVQDMSVPSETQNDYYGEKILESLSAIKSCSKA